jgi:hypothetical protein
MQEQTYGLALWVPFFGTSAGSLDPYTFRSQMTPALGIGPDPKLQGNLLERQRQFLSQWRQVARFYYGDFFPLTEYSADETTWMAWQWGSPNGRSGMIQAFRREHSAFVSATFRLRHLNKDLMYTVEDLDTRHKIQISGQDLLEKGVPVSIPNAPGAVLLHYEASASPSDENGPARQKR